MVEQPIIQATISSIETLNSTNSKFESQRASVENAGETLVENILCIAFL